MPASPLVPATEYSGSLFMNDLVQLAGKWLAPVGPHPYLRSVAVLLAFVVVGTLATWNRRDLPDESADHGRCRLYLP